MNLLIDAGNSAIKWALDADGRLCGHGAMRHRGHGEVPDLRFLEHLDGEPGRVLVGNVGGARLRQAIDEQSRRCLGVSPEHAAVCAPAHGVQVAYADPGQLGVDRWLGMIAARALTSGPFLVVDAGTAVTLDAVEADGGHIGGMIVPGLDLMRRALSEQTADIGEAAAAADVARLFATGTRACVSAGTAHAIAALIERAAAALEERIGSRPVLYMTGGSAPALHPLIRLRQEVVPDLVLRGLAVYAEK